MAVTVTKRFRFSYAHHLPEYEGDCANTHGHNAILEITVGGKETDGYPGMVIDFKKLKRVVNTVLSSIDHTYLNKDVLTFARKRNDADPRHSIAGSVVPTAENMVVWFVDELHDLLPNGCYLEKIRLSETDDAWVTWER